MHACRLTRWSSFPRVCARSSGWERGASGLPTHPTLFLTVPQRMSKCDGLGRPGDAEFFFFFFFFFNFTAGDVCVIGLEGICLLCH